MTNADRRSTSGALDETDVERAIADEDAAEPSTVVDAPSRDDEQGRASVDFTGDDLEREMEGGGTSLEEQVVHAEDEVVEVLDDERDVTDADLTGGVADELEWRMAEASAEEALRTGSEGDRRVGDRAG